MAYVQAAMAAMKLLGQMQEAKKEKQKTASKISDRIKARRNKTEDDLKDIEVQSTNEK